MARSRRARLQDIHDIALSMPYVKRYPDSENAIYQVGGKSFVFFRTPRPDALDPETGERLTDVVVFWVGSEGDKQALLQDASLPFFTTAHFHGHPSVLMRSSRVGELTVDELREIIAEAWLAQASPTRARKWLEAQGLSGDR